ncbi:MAG: hypothetical protein R3C01_15210 [Planctomycetaceae bacterium]
MTARYFYIHENTKHGPVTTDEIRALAQAGTIVPSTILIDRKTSKQFKAERVNGLFTNQDWRTKASAMSVTAERHETATAPPLPTGPSVNDEPPSISVNIDTSTMSPGTSPSYWKRTADRIAGLKWYIAIHVAACVLALVYACTSLSNESHDEIDSINQKLSSLSASQRGEFRDDLSRPWPSPLSATQIAMSELFSVHDDTNIVFFSIAAVLFATLLVSKPQLYDKAAVSCIAAVFMFAAFVSYNRVFQRKHFFDIRAISSQLDEFEDDLRDREVSQVAALERQLKDANTRIVDMNRQVSSLQTQDSNRPSPGESNSRSEAKRTTFKSRVTCPECDGVGSKGPGIIDSAFGEKRRRKCGFCDGHGTVWGHFHEGDDPDYALPFQTDPRFMDNW